MFLVFFGFSFSSCKKDYGNLNSPTIEDFLNNASKDELNNLVTGTESAMRINLGLYLDDVGVIGRELYRFSTGDPRYTTDLLGASNAVLDNTGFYLTNAWASRYRVVKNCNVLIESASNTTLLTEPEKKGYIGYAKTIKAYQLLLLLNLTGKNGIRIDVANPENIGTVINYEAGLAAIAALLDEAKSDLATAEVSFTLSSGFAGFGNVAGLIKVNRSLAARVAVYRNNWANALVALNESFLNLTGKFETGVYHVFSNGSGDQLNPAYFPQNQAGDVRIAHPSYVADIESNDDRISKATLRTSTASYQGLSSNRDVWVYKSSAAPVPIIRNEELILIYAEASIQAGNLIEGQKAINIIRAGHALVNYPGPLTKEALITEMLKQRRYSLFFEGHRWIDLRRYNRLTELSADRPGDDVWTEFPLPVTEL